MKKANNNKINTYQILQQKLRRNRELKRVIITPVVITINGLVHKESVRKLKQEGIEIDYKKALKYLMVNNMQDLMFYLGNSTTFESNLESNEEESETDMDSFKMVEEDYSRLSETMRH